MKHVVTSLMLILSLSACKTRDEQNGELKWLPFSNRLSFQGVHNNSVGLCISRQAGIQQRSMAYASEQANQALRAWLKALYEIDPTVTTAVTITCSNQDYTVKIFTEARFRSHLRGDMRAFVEPNNGSIVNTPESTLDYNLFLHEFGHAFANLGDTYLAGAAPGRCQSGQPNSIMCSHYVFGQRLMADDLAGLKAQYADPYSDYLLKGGFEKSIFSKVENQTVTIKGHSVLLKTLMTKVASIGYKDGFPATAYMRFVEPNFSENPGEAPTPATSQNSFVMPWVLKSPSSVEVVKIIQNIDQHFGSTSH